MQHHSLGLEGLDKLLCLFFLHALDQGKGFRFGDEGRELHGSVLGVDPEQGGHQLIPGLRG